jgi:hypothetical protein
MKSIFCALGVLAGCLCLVSLSGCSEDNEKAAKITGVAPGSDPAVKVAKTPEDMKKQADEQMKNRGGGAGGYPAPSR